MSEQSDYWNIDDILAEEDPVPVVFKTDAKNLAHLEGVAGGAPGKKKIGNGGVGSTLKSGTKVEIPMWLGIALAQRDICELRNPKYLS